jgi:hypothetical protein
MKWLSLAFFITASYLPLNFARIGPTYTPDLENVTSVEYGFKAKAFDVLYLSASDKSCQVPKGQSVYFMPFREDYKVALGLETKNLAFGIAHECDHEVRSWSENQGGYAMSRTEIFATLKIELDF